MGERAFTFGKRAFTFGDNRGFGNFWNLFFVAAGGFWASVGRGGPRRGFRKYLSFGASSSPRRSTTLNQGKNPWVDSTCAGCPGFHVSGVADARLPSFVQKPQNASLDWHLLH